MILVRYHGSKNGRAHDTVAIQAATAAASVREGRAVCLLAESIAEQITMYLLWGCGTAGHRADGTIETRTTRWSHDNEASRSPTAPHDPRFYLPAGCWRAQTTQHSQVTGSSQRRRAPAGHRSPDRDVALPPVYRRPPTLDHLTPRPRVRASSIVPWRALYGCFSATHPCISAAESPLKPTILQHIASTGWGRRTEGCKESTRAPIARTSSVRPRTITVDPYVAVGAMFPPSSSAVAPEWWRRRPAGARTTICKPPHSQTAESGRAAASNEWHGSGG